MADGNWSQQKLLPTYSSDMRDSPVYSKAFKSKSLPCSPHILLFLSETRKDASTTASNNAKSKLAGTLDELGGETSELAARFLAKSAVLAGVTYILTSYGDGISPLSTHILYGETCIVDLHAGLMF